MWMEHFFARFDSARLVRGGQAKVVDIRGASGRSLLAAGVLALDAPQVLTPVAVSGTARVGAVMQILPGAYSGNPVPQITRTVLRVGQAAQVLDDLTLVLTEGDLGQVLRVTEVATNSLGSVETSAEIDVALAPPTLIDLAVETASVTLATVLPVQLAVLTSDGTRPLDWAVIEGGDGMALDLSGADPVLMLTAMPATGSHVTRVQASNAEGSTSTDFALEVLEAILAPTVVTLTALQTTVGEDAVLPADLAVLTADGSQPLIWSVVSGGSAFQIAVDGDVATLQLVMMPAAGSYAVTVEASNDDGMAQAEYQLNIGAGVVAPSVISLAPSVATLPRDTALPVALSSLTANGTAPVEWTVIEGAAFCRINTTAVPAVLELVAMPPQDAAAILIKARNAAGAAVAQFDLAVAPQQLVSVSEGRVENSRRNPDGSISFDLVATERAGSYTVPSEAAQNGYPFILVPPGVAVTNGVRRVLDNGLYAAPLNDPATLLVRWESGTNVLATGPTLSPIPQTADDRIDAVMRLVNIASDTDAKKSVARVLAQPGLSFTPNTIQRHVEEEAKAKIDLTGTSSVQRLVVGYWGRTSRSGDYERVYAGQIAGGAVGHEMLFGNNGSLNCRMAALENGNAVDLYRGIPGGTFKANDDFFVIAVAEAGQKAQFFASLNGGPLITEGPRNIPNVTALLLNIPEFEIGGKYQTFLGTRDRFAIWSPTTIPDFTDPAVLYEFASRSGRMKAPERANAILGAPLFDDRGTVAEFNAGTHFGTWAGGRMTVLRPAV